jgi:competence protein ComGC
MKHFLFFTVFLFSNSLYSLDPKNFDETKDWETKDISFQFDYIFQKSTNYQEYKVIRKDWLLGLKSRTIDSLFLCDKALKLLQEKSTFQTAEIIALKQQVNALTLDLEKANLDREAFSLLGINIAKNQYVLIVWVIIVVLFLLLLLGVLNQKRYVSMAESAKTSLKIVEEDFDNYRRVAIEREQKVRRQLQDEILKQRKGDC